ncbi:Protein CBG27322 [Caenorhabditis briggsae]|uniref:Protein CBG27322 n=1 Tax=Caenorhabditis briggsae TaxID=6238 RepID=B6IG54_CAEBR|nr:Protein CBG27322 [Caenorhabditis briggsae]CAR98884.1 Protein CBG27322 [Caenorhabditis briggsae]
MRESVDWRDNERDREKVKTLSLCLPPRPPRPSVQCLHYPEKEKELNMTNFVVI